MFRKKILYIVIFIHRVLLIYNNIQSIQIQILWIHQVIKPVFSAMNSHVCTPPLYVGFFLRPGNGYDVLGLQSDTVDVLETNSSALRSFQVPNFLDTKKKTLEGLVVSCWFFFVWELARGSDFWLLLFVRFSRECTPWRSIYHSSSPRRLRAILLLQSCRRRGDLLKKKR